MNRITFAAIMLGIAGVALGNSPATDMKPATSFGYLDTDKDLRVSPGEAKVDWAVAQLFEQADLDHDGYLDKDEFQALRH